MEAHGSGVFEILIRGHVEAFLFGPVPSSFLFAVTSVCTM